MYAGQERARVQYFSVQITFCLKKLEREKGRKPAINAELNHQSKCKCIIYIHCRVPLQANFLCDLIYLIRFTLKSRVFLFA